MAIAMKRCIGVGARLEPHRFPQPRGEGGPRASPVYAVASSACRAPAWVPWSSEAPDGACGSPVRWGRDVWCWSSNGSQREKASLKHSWIRLLQQRDNAARRTQEVGSSGRKPPGVPVASRFRDSRFTLTAFHREERSIAPTMENVCDNGSSGKRGFVCHL